MNIHKDIRLALAALLVIFTVNPLATAITTLLGYDNFPGEFGLYVFGAISLLAAAVGLTVAYQLYRRSKATDEEGFKYEGNKYHEEDEEDGGRENT